jgi:hypothetical protein
VCMHCTSPERKYDKGEGEQGDIGGSWSVGRRRDDDEERDGGAKCENADGRR